MRKKLVIGNLKMNPVSSAEFGRYLDGIEKETKGVKFERAEIVVCPPAVFLGQFAERKFKNVSLGAQNFFWEYQGAFTGEISAGMMKSMGANYAIVGHSERRNYFGENDEVVKLKLESALKSGFDVILCIGENDEERKKNQTVSVLKKQLKGSLQGIGAGKIEYVSIAYEPVWAVGTDKLPTSDEILEAKLIIKKALTEAYSLKSVEKIRFLYGGSVKSQFVNQVCIDPAMDGVLVGRESLVPHEFVKIAKIIEES